MVTTAPAPITTLSQIVTGRIVELEPIKTRLNKIKIIQPDDWHVHFREGYMLSVVTKYSSRINKRCIAMPNTKKPITNSNEAVNYKKLIESNSKNVNFQALIPCYLTDTLNVEDFKFALQNNIFIVRF